MLVTVRSGRTVFVEAETSSQTVVANGGPDTLYYGDGNVSASDNDGSVVQGGQVTLSASRWVTSAGLSQVEVSPVDEAVGVPASSSLAAKVAVSLEAPLNVQWPEFGAAGDGSNATTAIQAAITAGGPVYLPPGVYGITGLTLPSNTEMFGDGDRSVLKVLPGVGHYPIANADGTNGNSNIRLRDFAVDGNGGAFTDDPEVQGDPRTAIFFTAAGSARCQNIIVERLHIHDSQRQGIVVQNTRRFAIRDNLVENNERDGITVYYNSTDGIVSGNTIIGCGDDYIGINNETTGDTLRNIAVIGNVLRGPGQRSVGKGVCVRGAADILIADNTIDGTSAEAVMVRDFQGNAAQAIAVRGNIIRGAVTQGIRIRAGATVDHTIAYASTHDIVVSGNLIDAPGDTGIVVRSEHAAGECYRITIDSNVITGAVSDAIVLSTGLITDVVFRGNVITGSGGNGIVSTTSTNKRLHVIGNVVRDGGSTASTAAIRIESADTVQCVGNMTYDGQAVATQANGLRLRSLTGTVRVGQNASFGNVTTNLDFTGTTLTEGFYGTAPTSKLTVTGSRGANAALASLLTQLAALGLITDGTS